ncbi:hypothetical protein STEG23_033017, partial [Scotinomys teguina]
MHKDMTQRRMALGNDSSVKEFILLGLTQQPELQLPLFFLFLEIYVVSMVGNLGLMVLIAVNPHLHTPMYFFLFNLAFIDSCSSSVKYWYAAICKPLLYQVTISYQVCHLMMVGVYVMGFAGAMAHTGSMLSLTFCDGNIISHYVCDIVPLRKLSCTSTSTNELVVFIVVSINVIVPTLTIFISYTLILFNILGIRSAE